ncbi:MAG: hypothetical protein DRP64_07380, partial [Verrucomicrobia bacterium]
NPRWPTNNVIYNNIFYAADTRSGYNEIAKGDQRDNVISHNLYYGNINPPGEWINPPRSIDQNPFTGNPMFVDLSFTNNLDSVTPEDLKVLFGSAAISNGLLIADNGGRDYFGYDVSDTTLPTLGFHEYQSDPVIDSDGDKMFDQWEAGFGLNPGSAADALVHSDSDQLINLVEFALGGNPIDGNDTGHPQSWSQSGSDMVYVYPRRIGSTLSYWLETSDNLVSNNWVDSGYTEIPEAGTIDADFESVTNELPIIGSQGFVRLRVQ